MAAPEVKKFGTGDEAKNDGQKRRWATTDGWGRPEGWKIAQKAVLGQSGRRKRHLTPWNLSTW
jgi:hypothetical protein